MSVVELHIIVDDVRDQKVESAEHGATTTEIEGDVEKEERAEERGRQDGSGQEEAGRRKNKMIKLQRLMIMGRH